MITLDILSGDDKTCRRDVVVLNAALALYVSEKGRYDSIWNKFSYDLD